MREGGPSFATRRAALPFVLPALDSLEPSPGSRGARARAGRAPHGVAARPSSHPERAIAFLRASAGPGCRFPRRRGAPQGAAFGRSRARSPPQRSDRARYVRARRAFGRPRPDPQPGGREARRTVDAGAFARDRQRLDGAAERHTPRSERDGGALARLVARPSLGLRPLGRPRAPERHGASDTLLSLAVVAATRRHGR